MNKMVDILRKELLEAFSRRDILTGIQVSLDLTFKIQLTGFLWQLMYFDSNFLKFAPKSLLTVTQHWFR